MNQAAQVAERTGIQIGVIRIDVAALLGQTALQLGDIGDDHLAREDLSHASDKSWKLSGELWPRSGGRGEKQEFLPNQIFEGGAFPVSGPDRRGGSHIMCG